MRTALLALGLVVLAAGPTAARPQRGDPALKRFCSGDAATFCADFDPGSRQMDACFRRNMRELSPGCRRAIQSYRRSGGR